MEKLIDLLNEYEKEKCWRLEDWKLHNTYYCDYDQKDEENRVISKNFWFIKWLVDNDKIDRDKNVLAFEFSSGYTYDGENYEDHIKECKLLMLLAIQSEPLKFLISILK